MKIKHFVSIAIYILFQSTSFVFAQQSDSTGRLGDNLDLFGVLELFKKSENSEDFEKAINAENNKVNNLDLNNDGKVDYIKAIDYQKDNSQLRCK